MHREHTYDQYRRRFRRYLRVHNRVLTVIGAFIVFITFVVKDGLRDRLRDLGDSIDSAESVYSTRSDTAYVIRTIADLQASINKMNKMNDNSAQSKANGVIAETFDPEPIREMTEVIRARELAMRITTDNLERLSAKLPALRRSDVIENLEKTKSSTDAILSSLDAIDATSDQFGKLFVSGAKQNKANMDALAQFRDRATNTFEDSGQTYKHDMSSYDATAASILTYAESVRFFYDRLYSEFNMVSYLLYTLGWGLGLISRIYGEERSPTGDD